MRARVSAVVVMVMGLMSSGISPVWADPVPIPTELVSVSTAGDIGNDSSGYLVGDLSVSADGSEVAFDSYASNLTDGDSNGALDVFVRNAATATTAMADIANDGTPAATGAYLPQLSANGRFVTFATSSSLSPADTNSGTDIYVRDLAGATTTLVSLDPSGGGFPYGAAPGSAISANGRYVLFGAHDGAVTGLFLRDRDTDVDGVYDEPNGVSTTLLTTAAYGGFLSPNGRFVGFASTTGPEPQTCQRPVSDPRTPPGGTENYPCLVSYAIDRGAPNAQGTFSGSPVTSAISPTPADSGPAVVSNVGDAAFWHASSYGATAVPMVYDAATQTVTQVGDSISNQPSISADGRYVAFDSWGSNGTSQDTNGAVDVFVRDRQLPGTDPATLVSAGADGSAAGGFNPAISSTGRFVAFGSSTLGLGNTGHVGAYLRDLAPTVASAVTTTGAVTVQPQDTTGAPVATLTFTDVTTGGTTSVTESSVGPAAPTGFQLVGTTPTYLDISTTATFDGSVQVCVPYDPAITDPSALHLLHYDHAVDHWVDITTTPVDTVNHLVCGLTTSFSPFALMTTASPSTPVVPRYQVLVLGGAANFSNDLVCGHVAVASGAKATNQAPSTINGDVYQAVAKSFSGPGKVTGTLRTDPGATADASAAALAASAAAASATPHVGLGSVTTNTTVNSGGRPTTVVNVAGNINLNNASLTLNGPANASFIVNVAGSITLGGSGGIRVTGGALPSNVLVNMTGKGKTINTHVGNSVQAKLLGPAAGGSLNGSFNAVLLGQNFSLMGGVKIGCN